MNIVLRDLRLAARGLFQRPGFAFATIATVGLAIAAALTAFGFIDAIYLRPLPAPRADRLVHVYLARNSGSLVDVGFGGAQLLARRTDLFDDVILQDPREVRFVRAGGALEQRFVSLVSANYFTALGLRPSLGRFFSPSEDTVPGRDAVAVISASLWHSAFASDPHVVGRTLELKGRSYTIVGVGPEGFDGVEVGSTPSQIWAPARMMPAIDGGCSLHPPCDDVSILARLKPGISVAHAHAELAPLGTELSRLSLGTDSTRNVVVTAATGASLSQQRAFGPLAKLLTAISLVLLLVACANLSGLLVARGVTREREIALRMSLGASRPQIIRQLLSESAVISIAGGVVAVMLSLWTIQGLMGFFTSDEEGFQHFFQIGFDGRAFAIAVAISAAATCLFGLLPAYTTSRADPSEVLKNTGGVAPRGRTRFGLIAAQVALTTALLSGAALLARSFAHLLHAQPFDPNSVALIRVRPAAAAYDSLRSETYVREVAARFAALPTVESVAFARGSGLAWSHSPWDARVGSSMGDSVTPMEIHSISPAFFSTLRIPLLAGREFTGGDRLGTPRVAMLSEPAARALWGDQNAVGRTLYMHGTAYSIVGVVPDYEIHLAGQSATPMAFFPFYQHALGPETDARFIVRVHGDPGAALPVLARTAKGVDPNVPTAEAMTMSAQVDASYPEIRLGETVLLSVAGLALFLSAVGLHGMVAFLAARRTREIGLRIALGAAPARIMWSYVGQGMRARIVGLSVGLALAIAGSKLLAAWLVGVSPHDVVAFAIAPVALAITTYLACAMPARRAARVDPAVTLRSE